jgi:hypothetical protein
MTLRIAGLIQRLLRRRSLVPTPSSIPFDDYVVKHPLVRFSVYTEIQSSTILELGKQILSDMDDHLCTGGRSVDGPTMNRVNGSFWLWVLGAYEIVRTATQAKKCFSPSFYADLHCLKKTLSILRMPFAKQELPGKKEPVASELSIYNILFTPPDLQFEIEGTILSIRDVIGKFREVFESIKAEDILADHRTSY